MRAVLCLLGIRCLAGKVFYWSGRLCNWLNDGNAWG